jgi:hypothetical protein
MSKARDLIGPGGTVTIAGADGGDVTYTHSVFGTFNVTRILRHVAGRNTIAIALHNLPPFEDLDEHRIAELMEIDPGLHAPVLLIDLENGQHIMIDGSHRTTAKRRLGYPGTEARVVTLTEARAFRVRIMATRADGTQVDPLELDRAFLEDDAGRHNAPDGRPRPGSTNPGMILPPRRT